MTVESIDVIAIATPSDWCKRLPPIFQPMRTKSKPCTRDFCRTLSELLAIARNCDRFIALFAPVEIGRSSCFGFGFFDSHLKITRSFNDDSLMVPQMDES